MISYFKYATQNASLNRIRTKIFFFFVCTFFLSSYDLHSIELQVGVSAGLPQIEFSSRRGSSDRNQHFDFIGICTNDLDTCPDGVTLNTRPLSFSINMFVIFDLPYNFIIRQGMNYSLMRYNGVPVEIFFSGIVDTTGSLFSYREMYIDHYLELPAQIGYRLFSFFDVYAGVWAGFGLHRSNATWSRVKKENPDKNFPMRHLFGLRFSGRLHYAISENISIVLEAEYLQSFFEYHKFQYYEDFRISPAVSVRFH